MTEKNTFEDKNKRNWETCSKCGKKVQYAIVRHRGKDYCSNCYMKVLGWEK